MLRNRGKYTIDQAQVQLSANRPVRWSQISVRGVVSLHDHEFTEICLVMKGTAVHVTESETQPITAGHVLVMPPGQVHAFEKTREFEVANIYFLAEWFLPEVRLDHDNDGVLPIFFASSLFARKELQGIHHFVLPEKSVSRVLSELHDIDRAGEGSKRDRWVSCCFFKVLLYLAAAAGEGRSGTESLKASPRIWHALGEIDRVVLAGDKLDLEKLAGSLGMTRDHLARCFKTEVGETPKSFHQRRRLQLLCRLLLNENLNLAGIAYEAGFSDEAHLSRDFRAAFGMTPKAYRRKFS